MSTRGQRLYDWWSRHTGAQRLLYGLAFFGREGTFRRRGVEALALDHGERVLELGCGPGTNFAALRERVGPDGTVVGLDYSAGMVERARETVREAGWENVHVVRADAATLPVTGSFDAAYAAMSLSAMPDPGAVLDATRSVLAPGGRFAVLDARPFQSLPWRVLNPVILPLFRASTNWISETEVTDALATAFPTASVDDYYGGSVVVATARLEE
ncbi:class I SAM-dependent methyltransferase [Halorientalis regularis]|uniref:Demethylmenaquinone methyltransferase / 2-methoxy-6-polyprenyl-1,4-benzoquinol methylase n=1 Tax=Halorientalis regularis TaxID=660518 RepID=A0A1G7MCG1_9EURY|nr:class I SAM-dependent methyltransferase [Halorientalis regularis]SDF59477.1 demethylmenaquinone methyltransferase / 2-methoxy-6-polyprenyl-1,4-benzoquinol methylase [Halorientalis regularis]